MNLAEEAPIPDWLCGVVSQLVFDMVRREHKAATRVYLGRAVYAQLMMPFDTIAEIRGLKVCADDRVGFGIAVD